MKPLVIDNFAGRLTRFNDGDINSGFAKYATTFGNDFISKPGNLTWFEQATRIDPNGTVITDLIMAGKARLENGTTYVYAIGHLGRLYKIQVNDPSQYTANYDNPVLLTTLVINTPTFQYGSSIQFFGATEKLYIGHDRGVTSVNFDGTGEAFIGTLQSYSLSVPRPSAQFAGKLYFGNKTNILEIDSTGTVISYEKLSPGFPVGTYVRDIDVSPDGNYVKIVVSRINSFILNSVADDTNSLSSSDSYMIFWNGTGTGYTAYNPYQSYSLTSNTSFGPYTYTFGYDLGGTAIYGRDNKLVSLPNSVSPNFNGVFSTGNLLGFASAEYDSGFQKAALIFYGQYDEELPQGLYRPLRASATNSETDVIRMPLCLVVSNLFYGSSTSGYSGSQVGSAKLYFSAVETSTSTTDFKLYKFTTVPTGLGTAIAGVYETQTQLFSKKVQIKEVRVYGEPWVANNAFTIDLIGSAGTPITNGSKTFTAGTNLTVGDDFAWYDPGIKPTYALGIRITNVGSVNNTINKIEIDLKEGGK